MTRVSLTEDYDDRSVIAKLKKMDEKLDANAGITARAEESARASAESAQETADRFAGAVGDIVSDAKSEIAEAKAEVTSAKAEVDQTVTTVAQAVQTANSASASAQASAQTVQTYDDRLQRTEVDIQTLDGETADLYAKDAMNLKSNEPTQTAQGLKIGTHDLTKAVTTDEAQVITGRKTFSDILYTKRDFAFDSGEHWTSDVQAFVGSDRIMTLETYVNNGTSEAYIHANNPSSGKYARVGIHFSKDGRTNYPFAFNPTADAPSHALVTKGYVESTDGATNNLVHRTANESIDGDKRFRRGVTIKTSYRQGEPPASGVAHSYGIFWEDEDGNRVAFIEPILDGTGKISLFASVRNSDGTTKGTVLLASDR